MKWMPLSRSDLIQAAWLLGILAVLCGGGFGYFAVSLRRTELNIILDNVGEKGMMSLPIYRREHGCLPTEKLELLGIIGRNERKHFAETTRVVEQGDDLVLLITPSSRLLADLSSKPTLADDACYPETTDSYKVTTPAWTPVAVVRVRRCEEGGAKPHPDSRSPNRAAGRPPLGIEARRTRGFASYR